MSASAQLIGGPVELQTRFLYPFFFERQRVGKACEMLEAMSVEGRGGKELKVWERVAPPELYKDELLEHVSKFLFYSSEASGCGYLRLSGPVGNRWFNGIHVLLPGDRQYPVTLLAPALIELFLSDYGVGVLSIALSPNVEGLALHGAEEFNYRLSQLRPRTAAMLRMPHPCDDLNAWERLTEKDREAVSPPPDQDAPIGERLGRRGATFTLGGLIEKQLIAPLETIGWRRIQNQLSVYTVARFNASADFEKPGVRDTLAPFLSSLAQIEEPTHAGAPAGTVSVTNQVLNRRHWAGVGLLGAAHLVADQPEADLPFNAERVSRVMQKYFVSYLVALLQRAALHRTIDEASRLVLVHGRDTVAGLIGLRKHLLEFAVDGYFIETSSREAIHRFYRMAQDGLNVRHALENARQAISDFEAKHTAEEAKQATSRQIVIAENMARNVEAAKLTADTQVALAEGINAHLKIVSGIQVKVEWIEIILVSVYVAHLGEMIASHIRGLDEWGWLVVPGCAMIGFLGTLLYLKPWQHKEPKPDKKPKDKKPKPVSLSE
ncbi:MAG: hypothetical protein WCD76_03650 [Pyrinomonadaceae bacterium]